MLAPVVCDQTSPDQRLFTNRLQLERILGAIPHRGIAPLVFESSDAAKKQPEAAQPVFNAADFQSSQAKPELKGVQVAANGAPDGIGLTKTMYLDMGHCTSGEKNPFGLGGTDRGFNGPGYDECKVNTQLGLAVEKEAKERGLYVVKTWDPQNMPPAVPKQQDLDRRIATVNRDVAKYCDDSIYVSIHHDSDKVGTSGQRAYYAATRPESMKLVETMQGTAWRRRDGDIQPDTKTQNGLLQGLRGVNSVGVLLEVANVQNRYDAANMDTAAFRSNAARRIVDGAINYFNLKEGTERPLAYCHKQKLGR